MASDLRIVVATVETVLDPRDAHHRTRATDVWWQVRAHVVADAAELAADVLWQARAAGIEERTASAGRVLLLAGFGGTDVDGRGAADDAAASLGALEPTAEVEVVPVADDGLDAWRAHARPVRAGTWWLRPAWLDAPVPVDVRADHVLDLDPGRTFGSGSHPTTRLVLAELDGLVRPGARVLDVGTGSGVLALAAARLGAAEVVATDVDPASPAVVEANARRNGVDDRVLATTRPIGASDGTFDLVLANLLAPVIRELAAPLVASVAPGGALVASGLLADRWRADVACLAPLAVERAVEDEGWVAVVLAAPTAAGR